MRKQQSGFTLIELIIVIVILGILAAFALPRFADIGEDARRSALAGAVGSIRSASAIVHSQWLVSGNGVATQLDFEGTFIDINGAGYAKAIHAGTGSGSSAANAGTIALAAGIESDFNVTEGATTLQVTIDGAACAITYSAADGTVTDNGDASCP